MTTTKEILAIKSDLKFYETLEIKRRRDEFTYETDWYDITKYFLSSNNVRIVKRLDFYFSEFGQFITDNASFTLDNINGYFHDEQDLYSLFSGFFTRDLTKIRYKAGYYDTAGSKINEVVFEGLMDEKTIDMNYETGKMTFLCLSFSSRLNDITIESGDLAGATTIEDIIAVIMGYENINNYINYSAAYINPAYDITFDDATIYEGRKVIDVLNELCQKTNSIWYIDSNNYIILRDRTIGTSSVFDFEKGNYQSRDVNVTSIDFYSNGKARMINTVQYENSTAIYNKKDADTSNIKKYGQPNILQLSGDDISNASTINSLQTNIISFWKIPKPQAIIRTAYMPNVINYYDKVTLTIGLKVKSSPDKPILYWNGGGENKWNNDKYFGFYENRLTVAQGNYAYIGFEHNISEKTTTHYLIKE